MSAQLCCKLLFNILSFDFNLDILNSDFKYINTSKVTRSATANKINIIVSNRAADVLCFLVSGVKFWNSLPNHIKFSRFKRNSWHLIMGRDISMQK